MAGGIAVHPHEESMDSARASEVAALREPSPPASVQPRGGKERQPARPPELTHLHVQPTDPAGTSTSSASAGTAKEPSLGEADASVHGETRVPRGELEQVPWCGHDPKKAWGCCGQSKDKTSKVWFIHPEGKFRKSWDTFQAFLLIYVALSVPMRIGFGISNETFSTWWFIELAVDCYFWCDIVFNFRTGYYSKDGIVIYDFAMIRAAYLKGWFAIDSVSCLPVAYIQLIFFGGDGGSSGNIKGLRMMRMLRLTKMLRLGRLKRIFQRYHEQMQPYIKAIKLSGMITVAFFLAHLLACLWYGVGGAVDELFDYEGFPSGCVSGWVHNYGWGMACDENTGEGWQTGGDSGCCVLSEEVEQQIGISTRYRVALYWAVTTLTTIGYGDITPKTTLEQWVAMFAMAAGAFLFGMLLGTLSAQITAGNIADQEYHKKMETVREFLRAKNVNVEQRRKIMAFYDNYFHSKTVFVEEELMKNLPEKMRMDLMKQMYDDLIRPVPFFNVPNLLPDECIYSLCVEMKPVLFMPKDRICAEGEEAKDLYLVVRGHVDVFRNGTYTGTISSNNEGFFGEEAVLGIGAGPEGDWRSDTFVASADSSAELMYIARETLVSLVEDYPELGQNIAKYVFDRYHAGKNDIEPSKVKMLEAILKRPIGTAGGVSKKPKKKRKTSVADIFLSDEQRAAVGAAQHEECDVEPPSTSKRMESTMTLLENPPLSPSEGMLKPIGEAINMLLKQTSKVQEQQAELLSRLATLEARHGDDM